MRILLDSQQLPVCRTTQTRCRTLNTGPDIHAVQVEMHVYGLAGDLFASKRVISQP